MPPAQRKFSGTIVSSPSALDDFPEVAPVISLLDVTHEPRSAISDMTETFARVYPVTAHDALRYAWQASCGLYAAFGRALVAAGEIEPPHESRDTLIDMAVANGDEHAIKFTEACLREYNLRPSPAYLAAARHAIGMLVAA